MKIENNILKQHIETNKISHGYLLVSNDEEKLIKEAKSLIYNIYKDELSKTKFLSGTNTDFMEIIPENKSIKISQTRDIIKFFSTSPNESNYKVVLINNGEYFRKESANAILKILEEPPIYGKIIITASNEQQIIKTIISRCQVINLDNKIHLDKNFEIIADKELNKILINTINRDLLELNRSKVYFNENKDNAINIYNYFYNFFHDLFIYKNTRKLENLYFKDNLEIYKKENFFNNQDLLNIMDKISEIKNYFKVNINFQIANEELLLYIMEEQNGRSSRNTV